MSHGNLKFLELSKAVKYAEQSVMIDKSNCFFYVKDETKNSFMDELKINLKDYEFRILDASKYHLGTRVRNDVSAYESDLKGTPKIIDYRTVFNGHEDLPKINSCNKKGILIFKNINCADDSIASSIHSLLEFRKLFDYELPEDWIIFIITNNLEFNWCSKIMNTCDEKYGIE